MVQGRSAPCVSPLHFPSMCSCWHVSPGMWSQDNYNVLFYKSLGLVLLGKQSSGRHSSVRRRLLRRRLIPSTESRPRGGAAWRLEALPALPAPPPVSEARGPVCSLPASQGRLRPWWCCPSPPGALSCCISASSRGPVCPLKGHPSVEMVCGPVGLAARWESGFIFSLEEAMEGFSGCV